MRVYNYSYFRDTTATRECTNTSDHFTNKKTSVLHYQMQSTLQYPVLANTDGELTVLWMQSHLSST